MAKKALIVSALAGFIGTFLRHDIETLQSMGYEVRCAGNASNKNPIENENSFREMGTVFYQVVFSSKSPLSRDSLKAFKEIRQLLKEEKFDLLHCHTPIAGAITRVAVMSCRKNGGGQRFSIPVTGSISIKDPARNPGLCITRLKRQCPLCVMQS